MPLSAQTAIQALALANVGPGSTVLLQGGAGGVGSLAIQIAHSAGVHVITTAQAGQQDTLLRLGADRVIDFTKEPFEEVIEPVGAVLDLVGGETLAQSYTLVKHGGNIVTFNQPPDPQEVEKRGIQGYFVQSKVTTELFSERGYDKVTLRAIAEKLGYAHAALYRYFPDKAALLGEICKETFADLTIELRSAYRGFPGMLQRSRNERRDQDSRCHNLVGVAVWNHACAHQLMCRSWAGFE